VPGFPEPEVIIKQSQTPAMFQLFGMGGGDPFYAVVATRIN